MFLSVKKVTIRSTLSTLVLSLMMVCSVKTEYELQISVFSFTLLRERCAICIPPSFRVTQNQSCDGYNLNTCDVYFVMCQRQLGTPSDTQECPAGVEPIESGVIFARKRCTTMFELGADEDFLGLSNPIVFSGLNWTERSQFYARVVDRDWSIFDPDDLIDTLAVDVDIPVGGSINRTTYTGRFNNAQVELSFRVVCAENYYGPDCTQFCNDSSCPCNPGFTGEFCETNINDCDGVDCSGIGQCVDGINSFVCQCELGFTGELCETNINDCEGVNCSGHGQCEDRIDSFVCQCDPGFTGELCAETVLSSCNDTNCINGECALEINSDGILCECDPGFTGEFCETNINDCEGVNCSGNGQCKDGLNNYTCTCFTGYTGESCDINIDDCIAGQVSCNGNGKCIHVDEIGNFSCACDPGYTGELCEMNIDYCEGVNCSGNGKCEDGINSFVCECDLGFTGELCEMNIDYCEGVNCSGNGKCINSTLCDCFPGYTGASCDIIDSDKDSCDDVTDCSGNGECITTDSVEKGYVCVCNQGYSGEHCEQEVSDSMVGSQLTTGSSRIFIVGGVLGGIIFILVTVIIVLSFLLAIQTTKGKGSNSESNGLKYTRLRNLQLSLPLPINTAGDNPVYGAPVNNPVTGSSDYYQVGHSESELGMSYSTSCDLTLASTSDSSRTAAIQGHTYEEL